MSNRKCGQPSWATTALLRLSHVLEHTSVSKIHVPAKCFRLQAIRCILHAHRDYTRLAVTIRSDILHQHILQLDSSLCPEPDASFMFGTNCPSLNNRPGTTILYACHALVFCDASSFSLSPSCCASANVFNHFFKLAALGALKDHESLGCRTLSAQRIAWETAVRHTAGKETELPESHRWIQLTRTWNQWPVDGSVKQKWRADGTSPETPTSGTAVTQPATNLLGKPPVFRGEETKWQEWYFKFRACIMCKGDRYLDLVAAVEDPAQGTMDTMLWDLEQVQVLRHLYLALVMLTENAVLTHGRMLAKLNEVLQFELGTDERTFMDHVAQREQRIHEFETVSRETLPDIVKRAIITERSPTAIRTHLLVNPHILTQYAAVRAATEVFLAVGRKWGQDSSGPASMDAQEQRQGRQGQRVRLEGDLRRQRCCRARVQ